MNRADQDQDCRPHSEQTVTTRRGMIVNQVKLAFGIGAAALFVTSKAKAQLATPGKHPKCFLRGTKIRTVDGERSIESVKIGDRLLTAFAEAREVEWVGSWRACKRDQEAWSEDLRPVRICKSALAPNVPDADVYVSQGHAILIDGVLCPAIELVNGTSITLRDAQEMKELEYFHIKLATHDVIFANGLPAETLLKYAPGQIGDNSIADELVFGARYCAPIICNGNLSKIMTKARGLAAPWLGPSKLEVIRGRLQKQSIAIANRLA